MAADEDLHAAFATAIQALGGIRFDEAEVDLWLCDTQFWSDSVSITHYLGSIFHLMATCETFVMYEYAAWRLLREGFHHWTVEDRSAIEHICLVGWRIGLTQAPADPEGFQPWNVRETAAYRFLGFASELGIVTDAYFEALFSEPTNSTRFGYACQFAAGAALDAYATPDHPWRALLPPRPDVLDHVERGFFAFPEHEERASWAAQLLDFEALGCAD